MNTRIQICLIFYFFLYSQFIHAQERTPDPEISRLENKLSELSGEEKIDTLVYLMQKTVYGFPEKGRYFMKMLEDEAISQNNIYTQAFVKSKMVELYYYQFDTDSMFIFAEKALEFARNHDMHQQVFEIQQLLIQRYSFQGDYALAAKQGYKLLEEAKNLQDYHGMALATSGIANAYNSMGVVDEALTYYNEAINLLAKAEDRFQSLALDIYNMIAYVYYVKEDIDMIFAYADTLQIKMDEMNIDRKNIRFSIERYKAAAYLKKGETENAWIHINKADSLFNLGLPPSRMYTINSLKTNYYLEKKDYEKALHYSELAVNFITENEWNDMQAARHYAGHAYNLHYLERFEQAAKYYEKATELMKENYDSDINSQINQLRIFYDLDKLQLQTESDKLRLEVVYNRLFAFVIATVLLLSIVLVVIVYMQRIRKKNIGLVQQIREQDILKDEIEKQREELSALRPLQQAIDSTTSQESDDENLIIARLKILIKENPVYTDSNINRKTLAEMLGTNENYLRIAIKEKLGYTFSEYMNELRLEHAKRLLMLSPDEYTIETIALESGFSTRSTLHRKFREKYKVTPDEYRKLIRLLK